MSKIMSMIWAVLALFWVMVAPVVSAAEWFHRRWIRWIPAPGKAGKGRIFHPPLPESSGEKSVLRCLLKAWETHGSRRKRDGVWTDLFRLAQPTLDSMGEKGVFERQSRSGAPHEAKGRASGVTRKENLGVWVNACASKPGQDQASEHAGRSVLGTVFLAYDAAYKAKSDCPFRAVSSTGKPATEATAMGYLVRVGGNMWSEQVNGNHRGVKRDDDGVALDPRLEKPVGLEIDPQGREQDPAIVAEETDPDLVRRVQELIEFVMGEYPEDTIRLWACGVKKVQGVKPWKGIRSMKDAYEARARFLNDLAVVLEAYRGPAVAEAIERAADKYAG